MHADLLSGMYTSQGSGDILVRMCGSWENLVVHLRTFLTHFQTSETVHYAFFCLLRLSPGLQTILNVLMHADLFSGMYTSQGSGDILVRMCGSWENFVVHLRTFRRIFKQVKQCIMPFYVSSFQPKCITPNAALPELRLLGHNNEHTRYWS